MENKIIEIIESYEIVIRECLGIINKQANEILKLKRDYEQLAESHLKQVEENRKLGEKITNILKGICE